MGSGCSRSSPPTQTTKEPVGDTTQAAKPAAKPQVTFIAPESGVGSPEFAQKRSRRQSVSSEVMTASSEVFVPNVVPKTPDQEARIEPIRTKCPLLVHLDDRQWRIIVDAMKMVKLETNQLAIRQGDSGDNFYIIDSGSVNIYHADKPPTIEGRCILDGVTPPVIIHDPSILGKQITNVSFGPGVQFGELALMYQQPRAASVMAAEPTSLWAIDRATFRHVLLQTTSQKRQLYTETLKNIKILSSLTEYERDTIADAVTQCTYADGECILVEGDTGNDFYMIEEGVVSCTQRNQDGMEVEVNRLKKGDYFGELAMLADIPRQATVRAVGKVLAVRLDRECFTRLFGPLVHLMKDRALEYEKATLRGTGAPGDPDHNLDKGIPKDSVVHV
eukprot:gnl/Spiro4/23626_TR11681_c0_g1_i1.p1 gnl/Spiro4/23626_TR11681_c0_g1~~gnl/Spiro4/23626_TR11681_c0_g1_i1.p1  ORF type:complete len:420 (-),score=44.83 gnl/Spiro4/23626_TR11681_c0_g1_i1:76-1242(-)